MEDLLPEEALAGRPVTMSQADITQANINSTILTEAGGNLLFLQGFLRPTQSETGWTWRRRKRRSCDLFHAQRLKSIFLAFSGGLKPMILQQFWTCGSPALVGFKCSMRTATDTTLDISGWIQINTAILGPASLTSAW